MTNQSDDLRTCGADRARLRALQEEIRDFVHRELEAQREHFHRLWRKPLKERVRSGRCVTDLPLESHDGRGLLRFGLPPADAEFDFREGDRVRISHGDPLDAICDGEFYREEPGFIEVRLDRPSAWQPREHNSYFTLDQSYVDLTKFYQSSIERLGETAIGRERILPLLSGEREPKCDLSLFADAQEASSARGMNAAQAEAIAGAVSTDLCQLIQGPPGTGKTHVLADVVRQRLERGERILVTAFTHRAIHNALNKIEGICPGKACKIGREVFDPELKVRQYTDFHLSPFAEIGGAYCIGATPFAAQTRLSGVEFDTVMIDEAGQMTLPLAIMAMLSGRTYIIIGDHKQLPPVIQAHTLDEAQNLSIFRFLHGRGFDQRLNITYRMNDVLCAWPSEQFYFGDLLPDPKAAARRIQLTRSNRRHEDVLAPEAPLVVALMSHHGNSTASVEEAIYIRDLVSELILHRQLSPREIAVVVPFRRQARMIRNQLRGHPELRGACSELVVDTVERMQGQEREFVIVGLTASDPLFVQTREEFLFQPNRLNVAVTRARTKIIVVCSRQLAEASGGDSEAVERMARFRSLVKSAKVVNVNG